MHAENLSDEASKQTLTQVLSSLSQEQAIDPQTIYDLLSDVTAKTLKALQPYALLRQQEMFCGKIGQFKDRKADCFQVIGFDVFVDSDLKAWVLEVNEHPSLNINLCLEGDKGLIKHASEVDRHIKTTVVGDAIKLMKKHPKHRSEIEAYRGWRRILPSSGQELSIFGDVKTVFD